MDIDPEATDDPRYSGGYLANHGLPKDR